MKNILLLFLCTLLSLMDYAQNVSLDWAKSMGGFGYDHGTSIAIDDLGNVYTTGKYEVTADFDPGAGTFNFTSNGGYDLFIQNWMRMVILFGPNLLGELPMNMEKQL